MYWANQMDAISGFMGLGVSFFTRQFSVCVWVGAILCKWVVQVVFLEVQVVFDMGLWVSYGFLIYGGGDQVSLWWWLLLLWVCGGGDQVGLWRWYFFFPFLLWVVVAVVLVMFVAGGGGGGGCGWFLSLQGCYYYYSNEFFILF